MTKLPEYLIPRCPRWSDIDFSTLPYGTIGGKAYVGLSEPWKSNDKCPTCGRDKTHA